MASRRCSDISKRYQETLDAVFFVDETRIFRANAVWLALSLVLRALSTNGVIQMWRAPSSTRAQSHWPSREDGCELAGLTRDIRVTS